MRRNMYSRSAGLWLCIALMALCGTGGYAQTNKISGTLKSTTGNPLLNISVVLKNNANRIIGFGNSNLNGEFSLIIPDTAQRSSLYIEVNWLGYKKIRQLLSDGKDRYDLLLEEAAVELKEVKVVSKPVIRESGDTLSYDVKSFSKKEDRTIGDVIGRLPGITVAENGQVYYNGKGISNLYIGGDDLMGGAYGLATKTINKDLIKSVDVMQRFQPIKVLKNRVLTENVAINLVLKDENSLKLSGQAMLGAGTPEQYDGAINAMLFNKKIKLLKSVKANNSGIDYTNEFKQFDADNYLSNMNNNRPASLLSDGTVSNIDIPRQNYYLNHSFVLNANNLYNTKDTLQVRSNVQLFFDQNRFKYSTNSDTYLPGDTIHYNALQQSFRHPFQVNSSLSLMRNKSRYYLSDNFKFNLSGDNNLSNMYFNGNAFSQRLTARTHDITNDFQWTPLLKSNNILSLKWYLNFYNTPQELYINKGIDSSILNNNIPYTAITQSAATPTILSNLVVSYMINNRALIKQTYELGIINEWQHLNSGISLLQANGTENVYMGDAGNALHWQRNRGYLNSSYSIKKTDWNATISIPLVAQSIHYYQAEYGLDQRSNRVFLNPSANISFYLNAEDKITANYSYNNAVGNISGVYRGAILTSYRSLYANDADLKEQYSSTGSVNYYFQRSITMLFINAGISYSRVTANSILSSILTNDIQRSILLPYSNDQNRFSINAGISKYFFSVKAKASLNTAWTRSKMSQLINHQFYPYNNDVFNLGASLQGKITGDFSYRYNGVGAWSASYQAGSKAAVESASNSATRFDQNLGLGYSTGNLFIDITGRHIYSLQPGTIPISYLFMDANIRYKLSKLHTDIEFNIANILNVQEYKIYSLSANQFAINSYGIRGRMGIVRVTFNL